MTLSSSLEGRHPLWSKRPGASGRNNPGVFEHSERSIILVSESWEEINDKYGGKEKVNTTVEKPEITQGDCNCDLPHLNFK